MVVLAVLFLDSCNTQKDYQCTVEAGTVVTNPDGSQYVVTDTETTPCSNCSSSDVKKLTDKGYKCK